jgi:hypothetical protein
MIFTITKHSFVDLITNSSTEVYVCDGNHSLNFLKDLLTCVCVKNGIPKDKVWVDIFGKISIVTFDTKIFESPQYIEYKKTKMLASRFYNKLNPRFIRKLRVNNYSVIKHHEKMVSIPFYKAESHCNLKKNNYYTAKDYRVRDKSKTTRLFSANNKRYDKLRDKIDIMEYALCKTFGISESKILTMNIKNGDIMVQSAHDNSIPSEVEAELISINFVKGTFS